MLVIGGAGVLFGLSLAGLAGFFIVHPVVLWILSLTRRPRSVSGLHPTPSVTLLVAVRNAEAFIEDKVRNSLALSYPPDRLEVLFYSDGSTDSTAVRIRAHESARLRLLHCLEHRGKIAAINAAIPLCSGEIAIFSDADALLDPDAVSRIVPHFSDPSVGGVCGRRVIARDDSDLREAQERYIDFDCAIKVLEARTSSITSNDGKLYAIRRELFHAIPPAVTDDLYVALDIVRQRRRFVYEPRARAAIHVPSRSPEHEVERRRRVVCQSLRGIYLMRQLLNPLRYGWFSLALAINKVLRRMLPFCLLLLLSSSLVLAATVPWVVPVVIAQIALYGLALVDRLTGGLGRRPLGRLASHAHFFVLGQYGTLLGVLDFLTGRRVVKWDPVKMDAREATL